MKKMIIGFALGILMLGQVDNATAQLETGDVFVDVYYGYSISKAFFNNIVVNSASPQSTSGYGPVGARVEFMIAKFVGVGLDVIYRESSRSYIYVSNVSVPPISYDYKYTVQQLRVMGQVNFHIVNSDKSDLYAGLSLGYRGVQRKLTSDDPNQNDWGNEFFFPVAARLSVGYRYFFSKNLAFGVQAGMGGGSFINGGLTYVF